MRHSASTREPGVTTFDGPPFANGIMHLGHYLAGTIKDALFRFQASIAKRDGVELPVPRFGWDCHGLPIEQAAERIIHDIMCGVNKENISFIPVELVTKIRTQINEIIKKGDEPHSASDLASLLSTDVINAVCFALIQKTQADWVRPVKDSGRIIDIEIQPIATMDLSYMNTVWQVFSKLHQLGLVNFEAKSMLPYSPMGTAISNSEATSSEAIKTSDTTVTIKFKLEPKEEGELTTYMLAWTTTPWSLPANTALAVDTSLPYIAVTHEGEKYILSNASFAEHRKFFPNATAEEISISDYVGRTYEPIFPCYNKMQGKYFVVDASDSDFVKGGKGTGVVHIAPAFGKEDYELYQRNPGKMTMVDHLDLYLNIDGKPYNDPSYINSLLKTLGEAVLHQEVLDIEHNVCPRTKQPLIYRACSSVMLDAKKVHKSLLVSAEQVTWHTPAAKKMFDATNAEPHDWCISRNRRFGTPIPVWYNDDGVRLVISSTDHFKELTGIELDDLHQIGNETFEKITVGGKAFRRVNFAFDCWFESGCMPYALQADAFAALMNKDREITPDDIQPFTAGFVAEGMDQVRGWFYSLLFLSSALFKAPVFHSVLANGMVNGTDGKKMSKSLGNYCSVQEILDELESPDALRLFLLSHGQSGDNFSFDKVGVQKHKNLVKIIEESIKFYKARSEEDKQQAGPEHPICLTARIKLEELIATLTSCLNARTNNLSLSQACEAIQTFVVDNLSKGFIGGFKEQPNSAYNPSNELAVILRTLGKLIEPLAPFTAIKIEQELNDAVSFEAAGYPKEGVLLSEIPQDRQDCILSKHKKATEWVKKIKAVIDLARQKNTLLQGTPLLYVVLPAALKSELDFLYSTESAYQSLAEKLNVLEIRFLDDYVKSSSVRQLESDTKLLKEIKNKKAKAFAAKGTDGFTYSLKGSFTVHFKDGEPSEIHQAVLDRIKTAFKENPTWLDVTDPKSSLEYDGIKLEPSFLKKLVVTCVALATPNESEVGMPIKGNEHIIVLSTNIDNLPVQTEKALQEFRSKITEIRLKGLLEMGSAESRKLLATDSLVLHLSKEHMLRLARDAKLSDYPFSVNTFEVMEQKELCHAITLKLPGSDDPLVFYVTKNYCSSSPQSKASSSCSSFFSVVAREPDNPKQHSLGALGGGSK
jgi:isoleucyl-tRNA synthetase